MLYWCLTQGENRFLLVRKGYVLFAPGNWVRRNCVYHELQQKPATNGADSLLKISTYLPHVKTAAMGSQFTSWLFLQ